jgi:hypothetical protein
MNLHYSLDDARDAGDAPWDDVVQDDFHVAIFKDKVSCNRRTPVVCA